MTLRRGEEMPPVYRAGRGKGGTVQITHQFEVQRPADQVWDFLQDVPQVAQCLPGAEVTEDKGGNVYAGKVAVKLGPMTAGFEGECTVTADEALRSCTIDGKGVDRRGGSRGHVKVTYRVEPSGTTTTVSIDADVLLSGTAAQFGRTGLVNEMSNRLIDEFVNCLEAKLAAPTAEAAAAVQAKHVSGISLFFTSLFASIRRFFRRIFGRGGKTAA
jgi:carbon monoxide dehydrogenase subunit G